jgi:hypothetical protein
MTFLTYICTLTKFTLMKKVFSIITLILIICASCFSQVINTVNRSISISKDSNKKIILSDEKSNMHDTVYFYRERLANNDSAKLMELYTVTNTMGQYFDCPQQITVTGVSFHAICVTVPNVACTVRLYNAGPDSLPSGIALDSVVVNVDSSINNGYEVFATFPFAVIRNQPYCITLSNPTANVIYVVSTNYKTHDGHGDNYSFARFISNWYHGKDITLGSYIFDADFLIHPIVDYSLTNPTFTKNPLCLLNPNTNVAFTLNYPAIYSNKMYNYWAFLGTPEMNFGWRYGDGSPIINAMSNNHTYVTPAHYNIRMYYQYQGWETSTVLDSVTDAIDICVGINENSQNEIKIYPNPALNNINIFNATGYDVELINILGEVLLTQKVDNDNYFIDLTGYSDGTYLIRFKSDNSIYSKKIIIE